VLNDRLHPLAVIDVQPPPDIIQGEEEYEVEAVLDHRGGKQRCQYLVKWHGYPNSDATWEPKVHYAMPLMLLVTTRGRWKGKSLGMRLS
jgi:hypothetical protein